MKRNVIILGTVVLLVVLAWTAAWFYIAGEIRKNVEGLAVADGVSTPKVTCDGLSVAGFPFRFDVTCSGATLISLDQTARLAELRASVLAYQPFHIQAFARGPVELDDALNGSRSRIDWTDLAMSVRLTDWRIARASLVVDNPTWTDTLAGEREIGKAEHLEFHLIDIPEQHDGAAGTAALAAYGTVTGADSPLYEIAAGESTIEAELSKLPDDVRAFGKPDALRRWQEAGGQLTLTGLRGRDADQSLDSTGSLALDDAGRLEGQFQITSSGVVERLGALVPPEMSALILGNPAADGSYTQTLNIRAGVVFSGLMPTGMIAPLW